MPPNDLSPTQVYQELLSELSRANASQLAEEIRRTVTRGVVLTEQETNLNSSPRFYREMNDSEALAVAIEVLVTALEVPLMINACRKVVGGESIEWRLERPGSENEEIALGEAETVNKKSLMHLLTTIIEIEHELGINLPEVV
jgi:hypothetical protein